MFPKLTWQQFQNQVFSQNFSPQSFKTLRERTPELELVIGKRMEHRIFGSQEGLDIGKKQMVQTPKQFDTNRRMNSCPVCLTNRSVFQGSTFWFPGNMPYNGKERPGLLLYAQKTAPSLFGRVIDILLQS